MKLDLSVLQYLSTDDFRVLTAIEMGMRNHEIVPVGLIGSIAKLKRGNTFKIIQNLLKHKLIEHNNSKYDGYSLNYLGYDFLALNVLVKRKILVGVGSKIGVGKESDIFLCYLNPDTLESLTNTEPQKEGEKNNLEEESKEDKNNTKQEETKEIFQDNIKFYLGQGNKSNREPQLAVLKLARLGRTSFRAVKSKRDYLRNRTQYNWLYLSRLSAESEFKNLKGLYNFGFPVPKPYEHNRHAIIMEFIPGYPLCNINEIGNIEIAFNELIGMIMKLASCGLVHGDFNEFNILLTEQQKIYLIDFPQMISTYHIEAKEQFDRDVECIFNYFRKKFNVTFDERPCFEKDIVRSCDLDAELRAPGYNGKKEEEEDTEEEKEIDDDEEEETEENTEKKEVKKEVLNEEKQSNIEEKDLNDMLDDLDVEEEFNAEEDKIERNIIEMNHNKIKEDIQKTIKKHTKINFKSNRFKNKKTAKNKNSLV